MGNRRHSRELAMQFLFQHDSSTAATSILKSNLPALEESLEQFWSTLDDEPTADTRTFAEELIRGCLTSQAELDAQIKKYAKNWDLCRIAAVDRAILRLAIYEMLHRDDIPPIVSINEAVDIAKKYSTQDSGKFVNGILDCIRKDLPRSARQAGTSASSKAGQ